jgi:hypothetical protein
MVFLIPTEREAAESSARFHGQPFKCLRRRRALDRLEEILAAFLELVEWPALIMISNSQCCRPRVATRLPAIEGRGNPIGPQLNFRSGEPARVLLHIIPAPRPNALDLIIMVEIAILSPTGKSEWHVPVAPPSPPQRRRRAGCNEPFERGNPLFVIGTRGREFSKRRVEPCAKREQSGVGVRIGASD